MLTFGSVCSGIEAASAAWLPLGWRCAFMSEIEAFPRAVLAHHYGDTPLHGDFTTIEAGQYDPIDVLVGGTPCQSFSVAGLRGGLADDRGNLALEYLRLADRLRPRWLVWENVPGVLSSNGGRDFGAILGGMVELGYGFAYRVLDAQFFGLAQRRRRVFVVGYLGDWRRAAAVLFERHSLSGDTAPSRETGPGVAALTANGVGTCGADDNQGQAGHLIAAFGGSDTRGAIDVATAVNAHGGPHGRLDFESETFVAHTLKGQGFDASEDGTGRGVPLVPVAFSSKDHGADAELDLSPTLRAGGHAESHANAGVPPAIAFALRGREGGAMPEVQGDQAGALRAASGGSTRDYVAFSITPSNSNKDYNAREVEKAQAVTSGGNRPSARGGDLVVPLLEIGKGTSSRGNGPNGAGLGAPGDPMFTLQAGAQHGVGAGSAVRRLTPRECERLQGFPDDYTLIPWRGRAAPDGPRYKALGNSMAVPVMAWIGRRIAEVDALGTRPGRPLGGEDGGFSNNVTNTESLST